MNTAADRYTQIEATLALANLEITPSEVHGTIVGAIANHLKSGLTPDLLTLIVPGADSNDGRYAQLATTLYEVYREFSELLFESREGFELVLPDEDEALVQRVDEQAAWARGYLLGL